MNLKWLEMPSYLDHFFYQLIVKNITKSILHELL